NCALCALGDSALGGYVWRPLATNVFEDLSPFLRSLFLRGILFRVLDLLQYLGNLRKVFAGEKSLLEKWCQYLGIHSSEHFEPKREPRGNVFFVLDPKPEEPFPN